MPNGSACAPIHTQPLPYAMPDVLREWVMTVLSSLPFQSTSHAASSGPDGSIGTPYDFEFCSLAFCCPIHRPPGASVITASALGYKPGDLNSGVVFAVRFGIGAAPRRPPAGAGAGAAPCCANAAAA